MKYRALKAISVTQNTVLFLPAEHLSNAVALKEYIFSQYQHIWARAIDLEAEHVRGLVVSALPFSMCWQPTESVIA